MVAEELKAVYKGKRVFVTGHTGFKGSWLIAWLHALGAEVKGYALAPEGKQNLYTSIGGDSLCASVIADIRDGEKLKKELLHFEPHFLFHLAAQPLVRLSYSEPVYTYEVNVTGTANVLDALRFHPSACSVVIVTTDKVYLNVEKNYCYKEDDKLGGYDPYSASKACAEIVTDSYRNSFFNVARYPEHKKSVATARAGNVIGGGDWAVDRIVPDIIRSLTEGKPVLVRNPAAIRPWEHVLEPLHGYLTLAAHQHRNPQKFASAYNFGPRMEENFTVQQLVEKALAVWGSGSYESSPGANAVHEAGILQLDISKAQEELGWHPRFNTEQAIQLTLEWYMKEALEGRNALGLIQEDINKLFI